MFVGIGIGINRQRFAGFLSAYSTRVLADGGLTEANSCVDGASLLLQTASLLLIPSGYKAAKIYSQVPTNGNGDLTWTRASDAWRTNANGLIQRVPWNLLSNTNTFSSWNLEGGALTSGFTDPEGGLTAYKYVQTTGGLYSGGFTATSGNKTASIWLKSVSGTSIACNLNDGGSGNFTTLTVTGTWQLFTFTYTTSTSRPSLYIYSISNASGIYVWHPQLVEGSSAQTYFPTTDRLNVPRLSYMYGSCPALLLEPQRTNLCLESENLIAWSTTNASVVSNTNETLDPFGLNNADKISETSVSGIHFIANVTMSIVSGTTYTGSIFYKKSASSPDWIQIAFSTLGLAGFANFNLSTGTIGNVGSGCTAQIQSFGNGWYRCSLTQTATASGTSGGPVLVFTNNTKLLTRYVNYAGNTNTSIYAFGAQFEQGSYATTYIQTTTASATRLADSFTRNNIYTNGLITSSGGTWFVEFRNNIAYVRDSSSQGINIGDSSTTISNGLMIVNTGTGRQVVQKIISGTATTLYTTLTDTVKIAIKWNGTSADVFVNGTKQVNATAFTTTLMEFLNGNASGIPRFIQQMALYPTPLSDAECITLTT